MSKIITVLLIITAALCLLCSCSESVGPGETTAALTDTQNVEPTGTPEHIHIWTDWVTKKEPTCTEPGERQRFCIDDDSHVESEPIDMIDHTVAHYPYVDPTCAESGLDGGRYCSICGTVLQERTVIPATGLHNYVRTVVKEAEYLEDGLARYECSVCHASYEETIPGLTFRLEDVWDGSTASEYDSGDGTEGSPYVIKTAAQLARVSGRAGTYFVLANDIVLNDLSDWEEWSDTNAPKNIWDRLMSFEGVFDGQGHTVRGAYFVVKSGKSVAAGLFKSLSGKSALVKNLNVTESYFSSNYGAGGIAGRLSLAYTENQYATIENCTFSGKAVSNYYAGGIVGCADLGETRFVNVIKTGVATITDCVNYGTVTVNSNSPSSSYKEGAGGIIGSCIGFSGQLWIKNCSNEGKVESKYDAAGIFGSANKRNSVMGFGMYISGCSNKGEVISTTRSAAGIVAYGYVGYGVNESNSISINKCFNYGSVDGDSTSGGIAAVVIVDNKYYNDGSAQIYNSANYGSVKSKTSAGGILGSFRSGTECYSGLGGCLNAGSVEGPSAAGIVVTSSGCTFGINNVCNSGEVKGTGEVSGIVGSLGAKDKYYKYLLSNALNVGKVEGKSVSAILSHCNNQGDIIHCYYLNDLTDKYSSSICLAPEEMANEASFEGFNFSDAGSWIMAEENGLTYPHLAYFTKTAE